MEKHASGTRFSEALGGEFSDYEEQDMETLFESGSWKSWDDLLRWLDEDARQYSTLTQGEISAMKEDLRKARDAGVIFTSNPMEAFRLVHAPHH